MRWFASSEPERPSLLAISALTMELSSSSPSFVRLANYVSLNEVPVTRQKVVDPLPADGVLSRHGTARLVRVPLIAQCAPCGLGYIQTQHSAAVAAPNMLQLTICQSNVAVSLRQARAPRLLSRSYWTKTVDVSG